MAFSQAQIVAAVDILMAKVNVFITKVNSALNNFPGAAIADGSVTTGKLAKPKSEQLIPLTRSGASAFAGTSITTVFRIPGLTSDSAAVTRTITGWSFSVSSDGTLTKGANNTLTVLVNGVTQLTIDLNAASLSQSVALSGTDSFSWPSGQDLTVAYTYGGAAGRYDNPLLVLQVETGHVD